MAVIPPPPIQAQPGEFIWTDWYSTLVSYLNTANSIPWAVINKAGSKLSDLSDRAHVELTSVQGGNSTEQYHLTLAQWTALGSTFVNSFNTRTGAVTLTSGDVTTALGYTPFNSSGTTGTGVTVLQTSPTLVTPVIGAATGTSLTLSSNASTGNTPLTLTNTSTASNTTKTVTIALTGEDTIGTNKTLGTIVAQPIDVNDIGASMVFNTRASDTLTNSLTLTSTSAVVPGLLSAASATITGVVTGGSFATATASVSLTSGTTTTIYTLPNTSVSMYLVSANIGNVSNVSGYSSFAVIATDGATSKIMLSSFGTDYPITLSGLAIQVKQSSGSTQTGHITITKVG
jgi:hypothetical protein